MGWTQEVYLPEAEDCQARRGLRLITVGDDKIDDRTRLIAETAYRRGYMQGAHEALMACQDGVTSGQMKDWIYDELCPWRYKRHGGKMELPPGCGAEDDK